MSVREKLRRTQMQVQEKNGNSTKKQNLLRRLVALYTIFPSACKNCHSVKPSQVTSNCHLPLWVLVDQVYSS